jgi:hypothetical protein
MKTTWQVTVERRISAPADRVWEALTDIEGVPAPRIIHDSEKVERLSEGPFGVGTRWRETGRLFGKPPLQMWVTACEDPASYVIEANGQGWHYTSEAVLTPEGADATAVRMVFRSESEKEGGFGVWMTKLFVPLGSKGVEKLIAKDLADIVAAVESPASRE